MTVLILTEYNTRCFAVKFEINRFVIRQKNGDISDHENIIYKVNPLETF